jgi:aspartyl-tRNA(Asn)/glutamyl-tRNA(Gln) amidotransferase subunit C
VQAFRQKLYHASKWRFCNRLLDDFSPTCAEKLVRHHAILKFCHGTKDSPVQLTEKDVRYVADLANLELSAEEVHRMSHDLGQILSHIEQLNELDTSDIEPMAQVLFDADEIGTLRLDVPHTPLSNEVALANTAVKGGGYYKVPKVIER